MNDDEHRNDDVDVDDDDDDDYDDDDAPTFIDMNSAVEVDVPDVRPGEDDYNFDDDAMAMVDVAAMDEEVEGGMGIDDDDDDQPIGRDDSSSHTFATHGDSVYAISSHHDASTNALLIASGGGDDRAYLHIITGMMGGSTGSASSGRTTRSVSLTHPHADTVSCSSFNSPYVNSDVSGKVQRQLLAVGSYDGCIALYDIDELRKRAMIGDDGDSEGEGGDVIAFDPAILLEGPTDVEYVSFHPRGGSVLLAGSVSDGTVWMYHVPSTGNVGRCMQVFVGHEGGSTCGTFTPDGRWVITIGTDGTCRIWAPKTGASRHVFRLVERNGDEDGGGGGGGLTCLAVGGGQDGQLAACGGEDGCAYLVHVSGKRVLARLTHHEAGTSSVATPRNNNDMHDDDDDDAGGVGGGEEEEARSVEAIGFCPSDVVGTSNWLATGGVDGVLKIWNTNVGGGGGAQMRHRCVRPCVRPRGVDEGDDDDDDDVGVAMTMAGITRLRWHASVPLVLCSYTDGVVCAWDARSGTLVRTLAGHGDMINDMSVTFVGGVDGGVGGGKGVATGAMTTVVVTGSDDRTVKVFEFQS